MPSGHGPFTYFSVPLNAIIIESEYENKNKKDSANENLKKKKKKKKKKNTQQGRMRIYLNTTGPGEEGKLPYCEVTTGPADCYITMFDPPISFMTISRLGVQFRSGKSEFVEGGINTKGGKVLRFMFFFCFAVGVV